MMKLKTKLQKKSVCTCGKAGIILLVLNEVYSLHVRAALSYTVTYGTFSLTQG